jgi:hypothetical protein
MKAVNLFYYSMTGNCEAAALGVAAGLAPECQVTLIRVEPSEPRWQLRVPFRPMWRTFLGTLLPTLRGARIGIRTQPAEWPRCDAVVVGSATWWDRPNLPIRTLVQSEAFRAHVRGKPVGLFAGCRGAYANNLKMLEKLMRAAGAFVVARDRFTYTGSLLGTFLTFFAMLRAGTSQKRWLGVDLPPYGFSPQTLARSKDFAASMKNASWRAQDHLPRHETAERSLRLLFLGLALFDLILGVAFTFFGRQAVALAAPASFAEPVFFQRCVGLFLLQYVYVQYAAAKDPRAASTCLNLTVLVRLSFPFMYLTQVALWGKPWTLLHGLFVASAVLDLGASVFTLVVMKRLGIRFFQGDHVAAEEGPPSGFLRWMLLVLAVAEFLIAWNWLLAPRFWCHLFDIAVTVDPFWTRATGVFLLNIAYIQFLGARDPRRYRTAAITSGIFRSLWPIFYWWTVAHGEGNALFRFSILFFSFFDLASCITIFALLSRGAARAELGPALRSGEGAV